MNLVIVGLLILILLQVAGRGVSFMGSDLVTKQGAAAAKGPASIFGLDYSLKCQASGFNPDSAFYSKSLTPGGFCGEQAYVRNQIRDFSIEGGIGGSLLDK